MNSKEVILRYNNKCKRMTLPYNYSLLLDEIKYHFNMDKYKFHIKFYVDEESYLITNEKDYIQVVEYSNTKNFYLLNLHLYQNKKTVSLSNYFREKYAEELINPHKKNNIIALTLKPLKSSYLKAYFDLGLKLFFKYKNRRKKVKVKYDSYNQQLNFKFLNTYRALEKSIKIEAYEDLPFYDYINVGAERMSMLLLYIYKKRKPLEESYNLIDF